MRKSLQVSAAHRQHHAQPSKAMLEDALEALIGALSRWGPAAAALIEQLHGHFQQLLLAILAKMPRAA